MNPVSTGRRLAIIGAGWAGCAAALCLSRQGYRITLFEASRQIGGRARAAFEHQGQALDNGQHILIGAYTETLRLMASVGVDTGTRLRALPLTLRFPDGGGLQLPRLPPPLDAVAGIALARGWRWHDKLTLLRAATQWRRARFRCAAGATVATLCRGISPRVLVELIEPLCVSALNTPSERACGQVFLTVLRDSLFAPATALGPGSTLLLPQADLSALFALPALAEARQRGAQLRLGSRVQALRVQAATPGMAAGWWVDGERFDSVVLAAPAREAARLVSTAGVNPGWAATAQALPYEAIATVYAQASGARLAHPLLALRSGDDAPAQFVFDRGQLGGPAGLLAFVVSASQGERVQLERQVLAQGRAQLDLPRLDPVRTVVEKRATFACTPGLERPAMQVAPGLLACGDYVQGPYPATLEGAVRSALALRPDC